MRKIYDCFTFFNELELLDLRLEEQYNSVDYFVIVEANKSFQNNDKPWNLENNWDRYAKYHDKIIYVKVEDMPGGDTRDHHWNREFHQRNAIGRGLSSATDDDVIFVGDCDEMIRPSIFDFIRNDANHHTWVCRQPIFWARINYFQSEPRGYNTSTMAITKRHFSGAQAARNYKDQVGCRFPDNYDDGSVMVMNHAGWHFSYLGDNKMASTKLLNFSHSEGSYLAPLVDIEAGIAINKNPIAPKDPGRYDIIIVDDYFPKTITDNLEKWNHLIVQNATVNIRDLLPR
jgi:Glycosyltransferase family 17